MLEINKVAKERHLGGQNVKMGYRWDYLNPNVTYNGRAHEMATFFVYLL